MRFHVAAFSESVDNAALQAVTPVADTVLPITNTDFFFVPGGLNRVGALYVVGANVTRARLVAPSLLSIAYPEIAPFDRLAEPNSPQAVLDMFDSPLELRSGEQFSIEAAEDAVGASRENALIFFVEGPADPVQGEIITLRFTNADTLTAFAWTNGALTRTDGLPAGRFDIVGMRAESAGLIAARLVLRGEGGGTYRPGVIGLDAAGDLDYRRFRRGATGVWGSFDNLTTPTVDFFSASADTSQVVWLDVIYTPSA